MEADRGARLALDSTALNIHACKHGEMTRPGLDYVCTSVEAEREGEGGREGGRKKERTYSLNTRSHVHAELDRHYCTRLSVRLKTRTHDSPVGGGLTIKVECMYRFGLGRAGP